MTKLEIYKKALEEIRNLGAAIYALGEFGRAAADAVRIASTALGNVERAQAEGFVSAFPAAWGGIDSTGHVVCCEIYQDLIEYRGLKPVPLYAHPPAQAAMEQ